VKKEIFLALARGIVSMTAVVGFAAHGTPVQLVANGGFETGTLSGWSSSQLGNTGCPFGPTDWNVSTSGTATNCVSVANPSGSSYAAYVMNDGPGPLTYRLYQTVNVSDLTTSGLLSFDLTDYAPIDSGRTISVSLGGQTVFNQLATDQQFPTTWGAVNIDVSSVLAANLGQMITLEFDNYIPGNFTGGGGLGLDNVSLLAQVNAATVPEPGTIALAALGLFWLATVVWSKSR